MDDPHLEDSASNTSTEANTKSTILDAIGTHPKARLENAPKDASFKIIVLAILVGAVVILGAVFALTNNVSNPNAQPTPTPTPTPVPNQPTPTPTPAPRGQRYVAFIKNDPQSNVYIVDVLGKNTQKLTNNVDDRIVYSVINWKSYDQMHYVQCGIEGGGCQIVNRSITSGEEKIVLGNKQFPGETNIRAVQYNHQGNAFAVYYESPDGRAFAMLVDEERQLSLKEFGKNTQRERLDIDEVSLAFSPDGRHLIVVTTLLTPNQDLRFPTLYVFNTETGASLFGLGTNNAMATKPHWIDNVNFYFDRLDQIEIKNILTQGETVKVGESSKDLVVEQAYGKEYFQNKIIVYWAQLDNGRSSLGTYDLTARRPQFIPTVPNFYLPQWYSATMVVAIETREALINGVSGFSSTGKLMMVNVTNSSSYELEAAGVVEFAVEPLQ